MEHKVNHDLERYLRLAAWGLPSKKRLEVRKELRGNIEMLAQEYQIQGHSETQALELALRDFGAPERVCVGMGKVYIMPTIFRNAALMALMATLSISTLNSSTAQVTGTNLFPAPACVQENKVFFKVGPNEFLCQGGGVWIHSSSLKPTLEPLGVQVEEVRNAQQKSFNLKFPEAQKTVNIKVAETKQTISFNSNWYDVEIDPDYISGSEFLSKLPKTQLPVTLKNWNNPQVTVGKTQFLFGTPEYVFKGEDIYPSLMLDVLARELGPKVLSAPLMTEQIGAISMNPSELTIQNIALPNGNLEDIFVLCTREQRTMSKPTNFVICRVQPLNATQGIAYSSRAKNITFVKSLTADFVQPDGKGEAILYRFTGRLDKDSLEVVPPEQIKILK
jgi:hypothetical protein